MYDKCIEIHRIHETEGNDRLKKNTYYTKEDML